MGPLANAPPPQRDRTDRVAGRADLANPGCAMLLARGRHGASHLRFGALAAPASAAAGKALPNSRACSA